MKADIRFYGNGRSYPAEIRERAESIAKVIRLITDPEVRRKTAREVCLQAVTANCQFPEIKFLKDCGVEINDKQGPALRVKNTRHGIRTKEDDGTAWGHVHRTPKGARLYRLQHRGNLHPFVDDVDDLDGTVIPLPRCKHGGLLSRERYFPWDSRMF